MKKNLTELVFILDKSGSMQGLEKDTIGGYNSMLAQQRKVDGDCVITTVLFDNHYQLLHDRIDMRAVMPLMKRFVKCFFELLTQILVKVRKCKVQRVCVLHFQLAGSGGCFFLMKLYH